MSLKFRINLIVTVLLFVTIIIGGGIYTVQDARDNVRAEIESTVILALHLLDDEARSTTPVSAYNGSAFQLRSLANVRHLKIDFFDTYGRLQDTNQLGRLPSGVPGWLVEMMDSVIDEVPVTRQKVYGHGRVVGELVVSPDPLYEIAEVWKGIQAVLILVGVFLIIANILIYYFVERALRPIDDVLAALTELELGNLSSRLPKFSLSELAQVSDKFNVMAGTLEDSIASNRHLSRKLFQVQEDERKSLARELHDEIGQHLTAIHVDASAILRAKTVKASKESALAIDAVALQMMDIVHSILQRLRPRGLDELGLELALEDLVASWHQRHEDIKLDYQTQGELSCLGEVVSVTLYRLIQECLTNVIRHAHAGSVSISISEHVDKVILVVKDNGKGFDMSLKPAGFGLAGMRDRVESLAGEFEVVSSINNGVCVKVELPWSMRNE